jgi:RecB family exonuclease
MITPRSTRLIRVADLRSFRRAIRACFPADPDAARGCAVIVPSRSAADQLSAGGVRPEPEILTREEFYARLRERLPGPPNALTAFEREVLLRRSAHAVQAAGIAPPFNLRPGLVREILALYDALRRQHRTIADFDRLMIDALEAGADHDRGAARLLAQTRFLSAAFERFEEALSGASGADEHRVRALALAAAQPIYRQVIVTVADQAADARGLWTADFDLLSRMPFLESIDVVATEAVLQAGYHQRLHESALPGIVDVRVEQPSEEPPILIVPAGTEPAVAFVCRDREEELAEFVRLVKTGESSPAALNRIAVVFQRPLPYLYLARGVFDDARMPYQALDSLPLAAEPFAAAVDLVFSAIAAEFTRGALVELLRSPHFSFEVDGHRLSLADVHELDRKLVARKYLGTLERLDALAPGIAAILRPLSLAAGAPSAPEQIDGILAFLGTHARLPDPSDDWYERHMRARGAVLSALEMLRSAHAAQDPSPLSIAELSGAVRRWIEGQTFAPRLGREGVRLLDASAAPYADIDELRIVGLNETDWPERSARSIFYPQSLLAQLGWPSDQDRRAAAGARFQDLLRLPRRRVSLSTFMLEDDAIVPASPYLEAVDAVGLRMERLIESEPEGSAFTHDALTTQPTAASAVDGTAAEWLALRMSRRFDDPRFRGFTDPRAPVTYAVSRLERYLECPFKYFAAHVLRLPEERGEEAWMTPLERGHFVHEVFERFFQEWQRLGGGAITTRNASDAMALFDRVAEEQLAALPEADRALERTLLLGSAAAAGFGERAFAFEIEDAVPLVERLLEYELRGTFTFEGEDGPREIQLRSKSDRIDLLQDGTLRVVDYKIGRSPERKRSLQLPIYGACAEQALAGRHGRAWTVARAGYIAFKDKAAFTELQQPRKALAEGQARLLATVDAIERGEFPVQPDEPFLCNWCAYPGVCRKDYVGDE